MALNITTRWNRSTNGKQREMLQKLSVENGWNSC